MAVDYRERGAYAHVATLALREGTDERAPGGAVTVALCGHRDHEGGCRWPHHTSIHRSGDVHIVRTVFASAVVEASAIHERIDSALRRGEGWSVLDSGPGQPTPDETTQAIGWVYRTR